MDCTVVPALGEAVHAVICVKPAAPGLIAYLTPLVTFTSFVVTALIAIRALRTTRAVARERATLDLIEKRESTEHYRGISRIFFELQKGPGFMHLIAPTDADKPTRKSVFDYLNHYEIIAIGLRQNILDEKIYRAWMEGAFVRDWNAASDFVQRERWKHRQDGTWEYRGSVYENYQHVACKWSTEARRLTRDSSPPPSHPAGPGDDPLPTPIDDVSLAS